MIRTTKQRLRSMEQKLEQYHKTKSQSQTGNNSTSNNRNSTKAPEESWFVRDDTYTRVGPPPDTSSTTKQIYDMMVLMEEATCPTVVEEV